MNRHKDDGVGDLQPIGRHDKQQDDQDQQDVNDERCGHIWCFYTGIGQ
jgi:hypothetical protein